MTTTTIVAATHNQIKSSIKHLPPRNPLPMTQKDSVEFDAESVTRAWDRAAEAYAQGQATGRDYYRCALCH